MLKNASIFFLINRKKSIKTIYAHKSAWRYMNTKKYLNQKQVARSLGVCTATVRRWKGCPRVAISKGRYRYNLAAVRAWLESRTADTAGKEVEA